MGKLATPDWIREGFDSKADYEKAKGIKTKKSKGKTYKIKVCPKCKSDNVGVVLTESDSEDAKGTGEWECKKCKWKGRDIQDKEVSEDEFLEKFGGEE